MRQMCLIFEVLSLRSVSGFHHPQPRVPKTRLSATFMQQTATALKTPRSCSRELPVSHINRDTSHPRRRFYLFSLVIPCKRFEKKARGGYDCFLPNPFHSRKSSYQIRVAQILGASSPDQLYFCVLSTEIFRVTLLTHNILKCLIDFCKIYTPPH
jgi:hypothetical protein